VDRLLEVAAWPVAIVLIAVAALTIYRSPISDLIRRARGVAYGNKTIDLSGGQTATAVETQKKSEIPMPPAADVVPASHAMPPLPPTDVHARVEQDISAILTSDIPADVQKAWLVRAVSIARIQRAHEMTYRLILGAQISLLTEANGPVPCSETRAREIYERGKTLFPLVYNDFSFENWIRWPVTTGLLQKEDGVVPVFRITQIGRDFLHYLVDTGLTTGKNS
jgi:hypothetical protein